MKAIFTTVLSAVSLLSFGQAESNEFTDIKYLPQVIVSSSNTQKVLDLYSENIIDYRVFGDSILVLKRFKGDYYLDVTSIDGGGSSYSMAFRKPSSIYVDCMKNVHILCKNVVNQIVIQNEVIIVSRSSHKVFDATIKKCVGSFDNVVLTAEISKYNQQFDLMRHKEGVDRSKIIYTNTDQVALKAIESHVKENKQIDPDVAYARRMRRSLSLSQELQRGRRMTARRDAGQLSQPYNINNSNYGVSRRFSAPKRNQYNLGGAIIQSLIKKKVKIESFQVGDEMAVLDEVDHTISIFSSEGVLLNKVGLAPGFRIGDIIQDPSTGALYLSSLKDGIYHIYSLNIRNGAISKAGGFKNISLSRSRNIYDGWLYYRVKKNDYYKLYRTRLRG